MDFEISSGIMILFIELGVGWLKECCSFAKNEIEIVCDWVNDLLGCLKIIKRWFSMRILNCENEIRDSGAF